MYAKEVHVEILPHGWQAFVNAGTFFIGISITKLHFMQPEKPIRNASAHDVDHDIDFDMQDGHPQAKKGTPKRSGVPQEKEEEISRENLKPLSEKDKQPKLHEEERIKG